MPGNVDTLVSEINEETVEVVQMPVVGFSVPLTVEETVGVSALKPRRTRCAVRDARAHFATSRFPMSLCTLFLKLTVSMTSNQERNFEAYGFTCRCPRATAVL